MRPVRCGKALAVSRAARRSWKAAAATALALLTTACGPEDTLLPIRSIDIADQTSFDSVVSHGAGLWLSGPGQVISFDPRDESAHRLVVPARAPTLLGRAGNTLLLLADRTVLAASPDSAGLFLLADDVEAAVLDSAGGFLLESIAHGEIVARTIDDLRPAWGWSGGGVASSALALSPEGDRLYQAVTASGGRRPTLRVRDLLSGRTLRELELGGPVRILRATEQGDLIGVGWSDDGSALFITRLAWMAGDLVIDWHRAVASPADGPPPKLAISGDGRRIALTGNAETGLTLFDGETGSTIAIWSGTAQDAAFDDLGHLYLLTEAAVVQVE